ncbi:MAG: T9SS type A sorting domain-containing protein [Saprospiraceae bacterium]
MLFLGLFKINAQDCYPTGYLATATAIIPQVVRPTCDGFSFTTIIENQNAECSVDYQINLRFFTIDNLFGQSLPSLFNDMIYTGGVPVFSTTFGFDQEIFLDLAFQVTVPAGTTSTFTFPFTTTAIDKTPFGGWLTQVFVNSLEADGSLSFPLYHVDTRKLVTLIPWDEEAFGISGSANISDVLAILSPLPNNLIIYPATGSSIPPTLTIDVAYSHGISTSRNRIFLSPGATIKVIGSASLNLTNSDVQVGPCAVQLAQGIVVEPGGSLIATGCTLNDSRFAIDAKPGSTISVTGTGFFDNYIGLKLDMSSAPEASKRVNLLAFTGNTFSTAQAAINAPFPGMPEAIESRGYCGILLNDYRDFNVFGSPGTSFSFLANGLIIANTTGNIANMFFNDMNSVGPAAYPFEGFGIRMGAKGKPSYMNINEFWHSMTFNNCKTGIRADYYHGDVENVTMTNVGIGIDWVNSPNRLIKLDGNTITASREGIRSFLNEPTLPASLIRANTITMTVASPAALNPRTGIELQEGGLSANLGSGWRVLGNTVTMTNGGQGILYRNGISGNIAGNAVNNTGATASSQNPYTGIQTEGNNYVNVAANTVDQSLPAGLGQGDSEGIYSSSGFANTYQCNCVNRTAVGMQFNDMADFTNAVRGNRMNIHNTLGLQLGFPGGGAFVGKQDHTGNLWDLTAIPVGGFGGRNWGNSLFSQFFVNPGPEHPAVDPQQWFQDFPASSFTCSNVCSFPPGAQIPPRVPEDYIPTGLDGASVNGTIGTGGYYPTETLWKGKYRLYRKMLRIPAIENYSSQYTAFKSANMNLPLGKLAYISEEKAKLYTLSSTEQSTLDAYWADLTSKISTLRNLDSLRQSGASVDPGVYNTAVQQRIASGTQYETYQQGLTTARQQKIQTLLSFNAGTSTGPIIEANHKTVNQIVLQMLLVDSLASSNLTTLTAIAAQCPLSGGDAVYEARAIVSHLTGQEYDDVALCGSQRPGAGGREETSEIPAEVLVFPNPTTGYVSWLGIPEGKVTVRVFNALGQLQLERNSEDNAVDLSALNQGIYRLQILSSEQKILFNGSISLLK